MTKISTLSDQPFSFSPKNVIFGVKIMQFLIPGHHFGIFVSPTKGMDTFLFEMSMKRMFTFKNFRNVYWHGTTHSAMKANDLTQTGRDLQAVSVSSCRECWRTFLPPKNVQLAYIMCTPCPVCRTSRTGMFIWTVNIFRVTIVFLGYGFLSSLTPTKLWLLWDIYGTSHNACRQTNQRCHLSCCHCPHF